MLNRENTIQALKKNIIEEHSEIKIQELSFITKINLRGSSNDRNFISSASKALNAILPTEPNTYTNNELLKIIWLCPNEWLVTSENSDDKEDLFLKLQNSVGSQEASVTDVSENRTVIRIFGQKLFTLLAKFLVLDLNNDLTNNSSVAQTLFIKVPVLLLRNHKHNQEPIIDIFTNRSHANYVYKILVDGTKNLDF